MYNSNLDPKPFDYFGPLSQGEYLRLPENVRVKFISKKEEINQLDELLDEKFIGVDSEWRPELTKFHKT